MFYFAYGSNMDVKQMEHRCPGSVPVGQARLSDYALRFDGSSMRWTGAAANVAPKKRGVVWGTLYELAPAHFDTLDRFENAPENYHRETVTVERPGYGAVEAVAYVRDARKVGVPAMKYLFAMVKGAALHGLPIGYIAVIVKAGGTL